MDVCVVGPAVRDAVALRPRMFAIPCRHLAPVVGSVVRVIRVQEADLARVGRRAVEHRESSPHPRGIREDGVAIDEIMQRGFQANGSKLRGVDAGIVQFGVGAH